MRFTHTIKHIELRSFTRDIVAQDLDIVVDYDRKKKIASVVAMYLHENKKFVANITGMLGPYLQEYVKSIDWEKEYENLKIDQHLFFNRFKGIFRLFQA